MMHERMMSYQFSSKLNSILILGVAPWRVYSLSIIIIDDVGDDGRSEEVAFVTD